MAGQKYASGKNAIAICDRDGQQYPHTEMIREQDTEEIVHISNLDEPDPMRRWKPKIDAIAIRNPRPDVPFSDPQDDTFWDTVRS